MTTKYAYAGGDDPNAHILVNGKTACGRPLPGEYNTGAETGPIPVCEDCKDRDPDASTQEIVETIAKHVPEFDADAGESPPQYFNHDQLVALKDEIERIKESRE